MRRRTVLRRAGPTLVALGLAGCTGQDGSPTDTGTTETEPDPPSPTPTPATPSPTETPRATPTGTQGNDTTDTATPTGTPTATATPSATPAPDRRVTVGPGGSLSFEPASFEIGVGDTVEWVWDAGGHNVKPSAVPTDADWAGTPGEEFDTFSAGYTYGATFEVAGTYEYYCAPHRSAGMTGSFVVG